MATGGGKMLSAEERRRQKELEEARKAGLAAPEVDEEGNAINPHIPQFMASAPWYLNAEGPSLKHQRAWKEGIKDEGAWYDRGAKVFQANKWRKGACENCGSMSHKTKDCMERPRAKGAKFTNKHIAADEKVEDIRLQGFDSKRDRWNGYNPDEWTKQAERFEKVAALRAEARAKELLEAKFRGELAEEEVAAELGEEEDKVSEAEAAGFAKVEKRVRTAGGGSSGSVRNLRIREDTAKYLLNLDLDSAYYDPKSRSMRQDPNPDRDPSQKTFTGDNFVRAAGEAAGFKHLNAFAVTAYEKGSDVHMQAMPSQAELAYRQYQARKQTLAGKTKADVLQRYGNAAAPADDDIKALAATEAYAEYDASGRLLKGQEEKVRSRYEEDAYLNNHTSVWGSWWHDGAWGYACCRQAVKNSYCTGAAGGAAAQEAAAFEEANLEAKLAERAAEAAKAAAEGKPALEGAVPKNDLWGTETAEGVELDEEKLRQALKKEERKQREEVEADDRKRGYNSLKADGLDVTAEDMEAYRLKRTRGDDPLAFIEAEKEKAAANGGGTGGYDYV